MRFGVLVWQQQNRNIIHPKIDSRVMRVVVNHTQLHIVVCMKGHTEVLEPLWPSPPVHHPFKRTNRINERYRDKEISFSYHIMLFITDDCCCTSLYNYFIIMFAKFNGCSSTISTISKKWGKKCRIHFLYCVCLRPTKWWAIGKMSIERLFLCEKRIFYKLSHGSEKLFTILQ